MLVYTPKHTSRSPGVYSCVGLILTSQKPIFHRALYFSFPVTMCPSLPVGDAFIYRNTNWCGGCNSLLGDTASRKGFWTYICTCLYERMYAYVLAQATVTVRCVIYTRVRFSLI